MTRLKIIIAVLILLAIAGGGIYAWRHGLFHDHSHEQVTSSTTSAQVLYTCPMHPFIEKDKPGSCPICGMDLVKKNASATAASATTEKDAEMLGHVSLSPTQRVMANVATVTAEAGTLNRDITAVGVVQFDQSRQAKVTAWIAGRIDRLHVNTVGAVVDKGKPVADIYSPELLSSQQEYLLAVRSREQLKSSSTPSIARSGDSLVAAARQRLMLFGVKEQQIADLEKAGAPNIRLPIYTPFSGVVIEKLVQEGQYVNAGDPLFAIADLSSVWVEIEVYENDLASVSVGQSAAITVAAFPGKSFTGRVAFVNPFLDPKTRTIKVRVSLANPGMKLKPEMFVNALIKVPQARSILVPQSAVINTGSRQVVWVEHEPGMFEPRNVTTGAQSGDRIQVLSGLKGGEKVAASGGYLIDSEAQLKGGDGGHVGHAGPEGGKKPSGLDMGDMKMQ